MSELGEALVPIRATLDKLDGDLSQARSKIDRVLQPLSKGWGGLQKAVTLAGAAVVAGTAAAGVAVFALGKKLVGLGSDAEEMLGKFNVVFAQTGGQVTRELDTFATSVGRSRFELMEMASTFGDTLKPMGFTEQAAATMAVELTQLATDLGSFNNMEMDEALQRLQGTLIGSHENALAFGVIINENTLAAELAANGWDKLTGTQLEQAKVQARINLLMAGTTDAQGDAARTAESWANQTRALQARLKDAATELGLKLLPTVTPLLTLVGDLAGRALPALAAIFDSHVVPALATASEFVQALVASLESGMTPLDALNEALTAAFGSEVAEQIANIIISVQDFIAMVQEILEPVTSAAAGFVEWQDVLIALGIVLASIILPVLWSTVAAILPIIAVAALLIGAIALVRNVWQKDWGGIATFLTGVWQGTIQPALVLLQQWLQVNIPAAISTLSSFWTNTLLPAVNAVWGFIQGSLIPLFIALKDTYLAGLGLAVRILQGIWQNVLLPALKSVWNFISGQLAPIFKRFAEVELVKAKLAIGFLKDNWDDIVAAFWRGLDFLVQHLFPGLKEARDLFDRVSGGIDGVTGAIRDAIRWLGDLKNTFDNISLPAWMTPGSPTPWETGLRGVASAMRDLNQIHLPQMGSNFNSLSADIGSGGTTVIQNTYQLNASYRYQSEQSAASDLRMMELLRG